MRITRLLLFLATTALSGSTFAAAPKLPGIGAAMEEIIAKNEIAGAVTVVLAKDKLLHLESTGLADVATQSGINLAGRIVEVVSGMSFDAFLQKRLFDPLGMKDTTFYPTEAHRLRLATGYAKNSRNRRAGAGVPAP